ncbi:hypothetical protein BZA77DRAFT_351697 [Pyronema omphalodes]|nr:hypothetical protein BZA77DRAFT_351697 [Pyronema omphalodes]
MSKSPIGYIFSGIRVLQLVVVIVTISFLSLLAVRIEHYPSAPPYQIIYTLVVALLALLYTSSTFLLHLLTSIHYAVVIAADSTICALFIAAAVTMGLPLTRLTLGCNGSPEVPSLPIGLSGDYATWILGVRGFCKQSRGAWCGSVILATLFLLSAANALYLRLIQRREGWGRQIEEEEDQRPVIQQHRLDTVHIGVGGMTLTEEIERDLGESPWGKRGSRKSMVGNVV